jgi:hypothetical protein
LSDTDGGEKRITGGIADEFSTRVGHGGFRPSAAEQVFREMLTREDVPHLLRAPTQVGRQGRQAVAEQNKVHALVAVFAVPRLPEDRKRVGLVEPLVCLVCPRLAGGVSGALLGQGVKRHLFLPTSDS